MKHLELWVRTSLNLGGVLTEFLEFCSSDLNWVFFFLKKISAGPRDLSCDCESVMMGGFLSLLPKLQIYSHRSAQNRNKNVVFSVS